MKRWAIDQKLNQVKFFFFFLWMNSWCIERERRRLGGFRFYSVFIGVHISCLSNLQCSASPVSDISVSHMTATTAIREENLIPSIHKHSPSHSVCVCVLSPLSPPICFSANIIRGLLVVGCMCGIQSHANLWQIWAGQQSRGVALDSGNAKQCGTSWGTDHYIYRDGRLDLHCTLSISHFSAAPLDTEYSIMDLSCSAVS